METKIHPYMSNMSISDCTIEPIRIATYFNSNLCSLRSVIEIRFSDWPEVKTHYTSETL